MAEEQAYTQSYTTPIPLTTTWHIITTWVSQNILEKYSEDTLIAAGVFGFITILSSVFLGLLFFTSERPSQRQKKSESSAAPSQLETSGRSESNVSSLTMSQTSELSQTEPATPFSQEEEVEEEDPIDIVSVSPTKQASEFKAISPVKQVASPAKESISPVKESISPVKESISPIKESISPVKEVAQKAISPVKESISPVKESISPVKESISPVKESISPVKEVAQETISPVKESISPVKEVAHETISPALSPVKPTVNDNTEDITETIQEEGSNESAQEDLSPVKPQPEKPSLKSKSFTLPAQLPLPEMSNSESTATTKKLGRASSAVKKPYNAKENEVNLRGSRSTTKKPQEEQTLRRSARGIKSPTRFGFPDSVTPKKVTTGKSKKI